MIIKKFLASDHVTLDSNVHSGGGTDVTAELQKLLDNANEDCGVHLIMDGAALVTGLDVSSNTTIECLTKDCGFYQKDGSDRAIITNKIWDTRSLKTRNITLKGGTYNQNCKNQKHDVSDVVMPVTPAEPDAEVGSLKGSHWVYGLEFYGVENLVIRDLVVQDFRTFAVTIGGFKHVLIENVWLDLPNYMRANNQDGFHFWGPGQFLTIKNVGGKVGDDFMNLGPDECDLISSITDVLIDGVYHDAADQSIRMLTRKGGSLDRVTVRNIVGTYTSFGFYINPWFEDGNFGNFKNIFIENVDLRQIEPVYNYQPPMLFDIGGNVESITIKNVRHHMPYDNRTLFRLGDRCGKMAYELPEEQMPKLKNIFIEDLKIIEEGDAAADTEYITVELPIENLVLRDVFVMRDGEKSGTLLKFIMKGKIKRLFMDNVMASGLKTLIDGEENIKTVIANNVKTDIE